MKKPLATSTTVNATDAKKSLEQKIRGEHGVKKSSRNGRNDQRNGQKENLPLDSSKDSIFYKSAIQDTYFFPFGTK